MLYLTLGVLIIELGLIIYFLGKEHFTPEKLKDLKQKTPLLREKTQFLEPISDKEKFEKAKNINDMLT